MNWNAKRLRGAAAAGAVLALIVTAGCSSSENGEPGGSGDEIAIGFALSQSGNMAGFDAEPGAAAQLAVDQINADGGIDGKQIRVIQKDVASDPETVGVVAQEFLQEGVDLIVTPCDFDLSSPALIAAQAAEVPAISICAGDPKTADLTTIGDFSFTANAGSDVEGATGASWAFDQGWESAYLLQDESIEYTKSAGAYFAGAFEELGGTIVGKDSFPGGDSIDISAQISSIKALPELPDFIYVASWNPAGATAMKQIREAGIDVPLVGPNALDGQTLLDILGGAGDVYYTAFACYEYCSGAATQEDLDAFVADFTESNGSGPSSSYALLGYNMVLAIQNALTGADLSSGATLRDALQSAGPVATPIGEMTYFSDTCHKIIDFPMSIVNVDGGSASFVEQHTARLVPDLGDGNPCSVS
ncbi:ABC transporter substrate-binding protein [Leucobacter weissii]|uniref:ABC transporter substrate-binding protein n=1 Tax=Leucobacter weissii TaxID=1983706 RepID=A0A939SBX6_9MICO|nr:ABC transporter substrate-binding protein [Leucobacter weissii]MBO1901798.1 ABC transporter substrate-binding protein [Leucobacter weissii]